MEGEASTQYDFNVEEQSDYHEMLRLVTEPVDWRGSTEGSRWCGKTDGIAVRTQCLPRVR